MLCQLLKTETQKTKCHVRKKKKKKTKGTISNNESVFIAYISVIKKIHAT